MKLSIVRTDKKNVRHLTVKPIEWFLQRIKTDTKAEDIGKFRHYVALYGDTGHYEGSVPMAMIHPLVEMVKTENGNLEITAFNKPRRFCPRLSLLSQVPMAGAWKC